MPHPWRQVEQLTGADREVAHRAVFLHAQAHLAFELVEELGPFVVMEIAAFIGATDHHHDEIAVDDAAVADRWLELIAVGLDPFAQLDRWRQWYDRHRGSG